MFAIINALIPVFWQATCAAKTLHMLPSQRFIAHVSGCSSWPPYLSLRQAQADSQFRFPPDGDVSVEMKLFLQLQPLVVCINHSVLLLRSCFSCEVDQNTHFTTPLFPLWLLVFMYSEFKSLYLVRSARRRRACQDGPIGLASLLGCFSNLHLFCFFRNANWAA